MWSVIRVPETPSKAAGPREPGAAQPRFALWRAYGRGEKGLRCFPEPRRLRDVVCCWKRVSLCRMQLPEARFGLSLRRGLGAERPSWLRVHGCGLGAEGLRAPNPASPRRRTRGQCDSGAGKPQQSSRAQGSRGSPAQLRPMERGGPGAKTDSIAFLSGGTLGLWFAAPAEFRFADAALRSSFWAIGATGPRS